jgi:hypothetical protein
MINDSYSVEHEVARIMAIGSVGQQYENGRREMDRLHDGRAMLEAAEAIVSDLPPEALTFVATSVEGVALAAVCAAVHGCDSDWQRVPLTTRARPTAHAPLVVEPVDGGSGWRKALLRRVPGARFADPSRTRELAGAF